MTPFWIGMAIGVFVSPFVFVMLIGLWVVLVRGQP
jgi:hypothetical protein